MSPEASSAKFLSAPVPRAIRGVDDDELIPQYRWFAGMANPRTARAKMQPIEA
jgi:hypothetical protein